jgi:hypothetical protein
MRFVDRSDLLLGLSPETGPPLNTRKSTEADTGESAVMEFTS